MSQSIGKVLDDLQFGKITKQQAVTKLQRQRNKYAQSTIDGEVRLYQAKKLMEWERYDDPTLLEYLRYYKSGVIGEIHIEAAIAQEANKARKELLLKLKQVPPIDWLDANASIDQWLAELEAKITAEKGSINGK